MSGLTITYGPPTNPPPPRQAPAAHDNYLSYGYVQLNLASGVQGICTRIVEGEVYGSLSYGGGNDLTWISGATLPMSAGDSAIFRMPGWYNHQDSGPGASVSVYFEEVTTSGNTYEMIDTQGTVFTQTPTADGIWVHWRPYGYSEAWMGATAVINLTYQSVGRTGTMSVVGAYWENYLYLSNAPGDPEGKVKAGFYGVDVAPNHTGVINITGTAPAYIDVTVDGLFSGNLNAIKVNGVNVIHINGYSLPLSASQSARFSTNQTGTVEFDFDSVTVSGDTATFSDTADNIFTSGVTTGTATVTFMGTSISLGEVATLLIDGYEPFNCELNNSTSGNIENISGITGVSPVDVSGHNTFSGNQTGFTSGITVSISTGPGFISEVLLYRNGILLSTKALGHDAIGSFTFPDFTFLSTDTLLLQWQLIS
jgi:hypothetical protein